MVENQGKNIVNKVVVVTGSSRGIGAEIVKLLAKSGHTVILNYNKSEDCAKSVENELKNLGYTVDIFKADVSKKEEAESLIEYTLNTYGKIDVLINNAGISQSKLFTDITDEDWNNMINNNLTSAFYCTRRAAKSMINQKNGLIINISSIWGLTGASMEVHYSTAKAGMIGFTKALAKELGPSNIRVNAIAPGYMSTDNTKAIREDDKRNQEILERIPVGRWGTPEDLAGAVVFLASKASDYVNGYTLAVDGGWLAR